MVDCFREPGLRVRGPDTLLVPTRIDPEQVRHTGRSELAMELAVLLAEACVATTDVEGEERRPLCEPALQGLDEGVRVGVRVRTCGAKIEAAVSGRVGRMEVSAPGLHHGEGREMVEREDDRAVAPCRKAHDRSALSPPDRPE